VLVSWTLFTSIHFPFLYVLLFSVPLPFLSVFFPSCSLSLRSGDDGGNVERGGGEEDDGNMNGKAPNGVGELYICVCIIV